MCVLDKDGDMLLILFVWNIQETRDKEEIRGLLEPWKRRELLPKGLDRATAVHHGLADAPESKVLREEAGTEPKGRKDA